MAIDPAVQAFWQVWWSKWHRRIGCLTAVDHRRRLSSRRLRRKVRASDVLTAWLRMFMPAHDPDYVLPEAWLALTDEEKRAGPGPELILRPRRVRPASERGAGFSMDDVGPYLKTPDGRVYRDRPSAAHALWRHAQRSPSVKEVVSYLPQRSGQHGRPVRGRTPERMLDALVAFGLVHAGMTRVDAAKLIVGWEGLDRDPEKSADLSSMIWHELHLPAVRA